MASAKLSIAVLALLPCINVNGQTPTPTASFPTSTQTLLGKVKSPTSQSVIKSVVMIQCPKDQLKGTGFAISGSPFVITNAHVVGSCDAMNLVGISPVRPGAIKFTGMVRDANRDLALLCPDSPLPFKLKLTENGDDPPVKTVVETWGYPLQYEDPAPLLSDGYVAGYTLARDDQGRPKKPSVSHLIINGAFNPGNSGGPLIDSESGNVLGIVVEKWTLFSPLIETVIKYLPSSGVMLGAFSEINPDGSRRQISNEMAVSRALQELYNKSQVMIGEAISISELTNFMQEKKSSVTCTPAK